MSILIIYMTSRSRKHDFTFITCLTLLSSYLRMLSGAKYAQNMHDRSSTSNSASEPSTDTRQLRFYLNCC